MANIVDAPRIFRKEGLNLPYYLNETQNGQLLIDRGYVIEGARLGPYDQVHEFITTSRVHLRGLVPEEQRLTANTDNLTVLGLTQPAIRKAMDAISDLANDTNRSSGDSKDRQVYRAALKTVYRAMAKEVDDWILDGREEPLVFAPKNGGIFVREVFEEEGFFPDDFFDYRMSRVQKNDGGLMVGITNGDGNPEISNSRSFVFADDCIASDISAFATMEMIKEALIEANVPLVRAKVLITASAASQRGIESLLSPQTRDYFGFESIRAVVGVLVHQMDGHFYLRHPDGRLAVGDMGEWTQPPTE